MSHTTSQCPLPTSTRTFQPEIYNNASNSIQAHYAIVCSLSALYGVLAVLSTMSVYTLTTQQNGRIHRTTIILCLTIVVLFASTTVYMVTTILRYQADDLAYFFYSDDGIWSYSMPIDSLGIPPELADNQGLFGARRLHACASATTLAFNVVLGDAIVWWRVCVVWQKNRVVRFVCGFFLCVTIVVGSLSAGRSCISAAIDVESDGIMFGQEFFGSVAYGISLGTNLLATCLVAYKAWQSRRRFRQYLVAKVGGSQVEKLMTLLIESGVVYSVLLIVVLAHQVLSFQNWIDRFSLPAQDITVLSLLSVFINGAFIPAIAIYPTIIIVIVALNRSHMERGLTQHLEAVPTPRLPLTIDTLTIETSLTRESFVHGTQMDKNDLEKAKSLRGGDLDSEGSDLDSEETVEEGKLYGKPLQHA